MHFYLKLEGRGAWVLFIHFFITFVLCKCFVKLLQGDGGMVFFSLFFKKIILKGGRGCGMGFFSFTFCYSFIIWKFFVTFCLFSRRKEGMSFFEFFLILELGKWMWVLLFYIFTFF